tara:strand:+ start:18457 stop:18654 length:198 start_codon:yes stop_codon:yes gene_type:complete
MTDKPIDEETLTKEVFLFLDILKESGVTNMLGSVPYIMAEFNINKIKSRKLLISWIKNIENENTV